MLNTIEDQKGLLQTYHIIIITSKPLITDIIGLIIIIMGKKSNIFRRFPNATDTLLMGGTKKANVSIFGILKQTLYHRRRLMIKDKKFTKKRNYMQSG